MIDTVNGSSDTLNFSTGDSAAVVGNGDTLGLTNGDTASLGGLGFSVAASADTIYLAASTTATVTGSGDNIGVNGSGDTLTGSDDTVGFLNGLTDTIYGSGDVLNSGKTDSGTVVGANDALNLTSGDIASLGGLGFSVAASADTIYLAASTSATVTGSGDSIGVNGSGDTLTGSNDTIGFLNGLTDTVNGSRDILNFGSADTNTVIGDGEMVNLGSNCNLSLDGSNSNFYMNPGDLVDVTASQSGLSTDTGYGVAGDVAIFSDSTLGDSQRQELDPTSTISLEYSDYGGLDASGKLENTTFDNNNGTSATTWYDPTGYADVIQATNQFTGLDDSGELTSEVFTTTGNETYDDNFVYNAGQITDVWQEVTVTSTGKELADDEFNDAGQLVDAAYGYATGYQVATGYAYSYEVRAPDTDTLERSHQRLADFAVRSVAQTSVFDANSAHPSAASPYAGTLAPPASVATESPYSTTNVIPVQNAAAAGSDPAPAGSGLALTEPVANVASPSFIDNPETGNHLGSSLSDLSAPPNLAEIATFASSSLAGSATDWAQQPPTPDFIGPAVPDHASMTGPHPAYPSLSNAGSGMALITHVA